jgi:predicted PurR-regulated permease PerM
MTSTQRQTLSWMGLGLLAILVVWSLGPVLTPFFIAGVLAYVLQPSVERLVRLRVPRVLAVAVIEAATLLVILAVLLLIIPILSKQLPLLREQIPLLVERLSTHLSPWLGRVGIHVALDMDSLQAFVLKYLGGNVEAWSATLFSSAKIGGSVLLAVLGYVFLVPVVLFYLLMDWPTLGPRLNALIPPRLRITVRGFVIECDDVLGQYLRGQLFVMLILAAYYGVALALCGLELAVPVGLFTGLAIFIPYVGFGLGLVLALISAVLQFASWYGVVSVIVVYSIGQVVESFVLTPRLVGERIGMSALTVIFALLAFGHLFGFVGVLIALPVSAVLVVAMRRLRDSYVTSELYRG